MSDLLEKIIVFIDQHKLLKKNDAVLVAVSGGIDSVVLLHLLNSLKEIFRLQIHILHLNHLLRNKESDADQVFVETLANKYHLPIISKKVNTPAFIKKNRLSEEEGARILRYRFFDWALRKTGSDLVALGHNADDQVETILDHFFRGSGLKGLSGMVVHRDYFIRPLIFAYRKEIETYATVKSLQYVIDSTNSMIKYRRNRIRHELLPYLKEHFNHSVDDVLLRTGKLMQETESYIEIQAKSAFYYCLINSKKNKIILDINSFLSYFITIKKYIIYLVLDKLEIPRFVLNSRKFDDILLLITKQNHGKKIFITKEWFCQIEYNTIVFRIVTEPEFIIKIEVKKKYSLLNGELSFFADEINKEQLPNLFSNNKNTEYIDSDKIIGNLQIRYFKAGDRFWPINFKGEKKISDFFTDQKIPQHERNEIPLLICETGIIWIIGFQIDDRFKVTNETKRILKLQVKRDSLNE